LALLIDRVFNDVATPILDNHAVACLEFCHKRSNVRLAVRKIEEPLARRHDQQPTSMAVCDIRDVKWVRIADR